jgi:hypothetical protein
MTTIKLGFCNPPDPIYLYVNSGELNGQPYVWYQFDINSNQTIPIYSRALTGFFTELRLTQKEFKGKDNLKLDIVINADELYIIRTGIETNFAKTFLLAASQVEDFTQPVIIAATPGEENVVFCRLYDGITKTRFRRDWEPSANWGDIITSIQVRLGNKEVSLPIPTPQNSPPYSQDLRVKEVRMLLNYPVDSVKQWLDFQGVKTPSQLPPEKVDSLIQKMCLAWASDKFSGYTYAINSYKKYVIHPVASGADEVTTVQSWMGIVLKQPITQAQAK